MVIERRRGMRLLTAGLGWSLVGLGPVLLVGLLITRSFYPNTIGWLRVGSAIVLSAVGFWLTTANRPDWLVIRVDGAGFTLRRGRREWVCPWPDVTGIDVTTRASGRTSVPTVRVACAGMRDLYLDDVFTLRTRDLGALLRKRCAEAGNALVRPPATAARRAGWRPGRASWRVLWLMAGLLVAMALLRVLRDAF